MIPLNKLDVKVPIHTFELCHHCARRCANTEECKTTSRCKLILIWDIFLSGCSVVRFRMCHRWYNQLCVFQVNRRTFTDTHCLFLSMNRDLIYTLTIVYAIIWFNIILCTLSKWYVHWTDSFEVLCHQVRSQRSRPAVMMNPHRLSGWPQNVLPHGGVYNCFTLLGVL